MSQNNTYEKTKNIMSSYVPEFSYEETSDEPGCVLTKLCADMVEDSALRFDQTLPKHKIQYLNMLDFLKKEPVSAAKGYVQFQPVSGYENGMIMVPGHTQVMSNQAQGEIIFETQHDMTATGAKPMMAVVTDKKKDCITCVDLEDSESTTFRAFDVSGKNVSTHKMYLCFNHIFDYLTALDFDLYVEARTKDNVEIQKETILGLTQEGVTWAILDAEGNEIPFDVVQPTQDYIHFEMEAYQPQLAAVGQREGYYLVVSASKSLPDIFVDIIQVTLQKKNVIPEEVYLNQISENTGSFLPFGKPMGLYNEMGIESKEIFSKKGAHITLEFNLDYVRHEEVLEMVEIDPEYRSIMKKPQKAAAVRSSEVHADYVIWEYLSVNGWRRLMKEEYLSSMFDGTAPGNRKVEFVCPADMAPFDEENMSGRIRIRLLRAENIYKIPATYVCPRISGLMLSYEYREKQFADYAFTQNNFEWRDVTTELMQSASVRPFYNNENKQRTMYLAFDASPAGSPTSVYFDIENFSDRPIDFTVEYLSDTGFKAIKVIDSTAGFLGSGNILMLIPKDMKKTTLYGREGYFIRFVNYNEEHYEYALPIIHGIYMNMAKVVNVNEREELFYIDNNETALDLALSQQNLLRAQVWVKEKTQDGEEWILWQEAGAYQIIPRTYQIDMALGMLHFSKQVLINTDFGTTDAQIRVTHYNYTGSKANLKTGQINTLRNAVSYITGVRNPFPTYGGYDGYTQESSSKLISSILRTRNRAVTSQDFFDIISQTSFGVRKVKCMTDVDLFGNDKPGCVTIAVLIDEYEKGVHIFSEMKDTIRKKLIEASGLLPMGKEVILSQPHFVKLNVRVWIERDTMEQAFDMQTKALQVIRDFIDPLKGGTNGEGREIGQFPRASQIIAALRTHILDCNISKILLTANVDGEEIPVREDFYSKHGGPFIMAINGEHIVYIELK